MRKETLNVLSIEDNPGDALLIEELLAEAGALGWDLPRYVVDWVDSLKLGLGRLDEATRGARQIDVVLTDLDLPDSRAGETFTQLRAYVPDMPIVVLTGRDDAELARQTVRAGAEDYLFKREMSGSLLAHALCYAVERQQAKQSLQAQEARYRALVEAQLEMALEMGRADNWDMDLRAGTLHYTDRWAAMLGYAPGEIPKTREAVTEIIHPDDLSKTQDDLKAYLEGRVPIYETECRLKNKAGDWIWIVSRGKAVEWDAEGRPVRLMGINFDITARKRTEIELIEAEGMWERTFDAVPDLVAIIDKDYRIVRANRAMADRLGLTPAQCEGLTCYESVHGTDAPPAFCPHACLLQDELEHKADVHEDRLGGDFVVSVSPIYDAEGTLLGSVHIARDMTDILHAETVLRRHEERFRSIFMESPIAVVIYDEEGTLIDANPSALDMFGIPNLADAQGLSMLDNPSLKPEHWEKLQNREVVRLQSSLDFDNIRRLGLYEPLKSGVAYIDWVITSFVHGGYMVQIQDITERKRTEEKLRLTQFSVDAASMSVFWITPEGTFFYVNDAACQKLGYTRAELLGMHIADVDPNYPCETRDQFWAMFEKDKVLTFESMHRTKDGRTFPVEITNHYLQFDGQKYEFAFAVDITERKRAKQALEHYAAELKRSNEDLQQFAYTVSHDLQYPLRMVTQYLKLLLEHCDERLDETGREFIDWAMDGAGRMKHLINDLLAYARVGSRGQALQPVDAEEVLARTLRSLCFDVEAQDAEITHDPLPIVMADEVQLGQVFQNLISNALKFHSDVPPRVHITAERLEEAQFLEEDVNLDDVSLEAIPLKDAWVFSVRDNGIGISVDDQARIFGIFQRLHTEEEYPGTGIGLAICKRIIARHGGRIWVESQVGHGATFYFTLPVEDEGALARG